MIRDLLRVLGQEYARPVRRTIALMTAAAVAEGLSYAWVVVSLTALLGPDPEEAWPWLIALAGSVAGYGVVRYLADLSGFGSGTTLLRGLYHRLGDHLARLPLGWYDRGRVGEVSVLASKGVLQVMGVIAHLLGPLISATVTPAVIIVVMLVVDWRLGAAGLVAVPLVVAVHVRTRRAVAASDAERAARDLEASDRVIEYLQAQPVLRSAGRVGGRFGMLNEALRGLQRAGRRSAIAALPGVVGLSLTVQAVLTALLALAAHLVLGGSAEPAPVLALLVLAVRCADPLLSLTELGGQLHAARNELIRVAAVLDTPPLPDPGRPRATDGHAVEFDSVTFRPADRAVIDEVSLFLPEGCRLAVVGPSGSGKTTLLRLLARFFDVDSGAVRVGGVDVREIDVESLMARIAIVFQDVHLFDATIEENIRVGRPDADDAAVRAAATAAQLNEVIDRLPGGWSATVGEGGRLLSGGERQRVSIARALLKDAPIVVLDEVTSALDPANETAVHEGIERLMAGRTVIMVAHRLRTVRDVDRVVFLDRGRVVEEGSHDELLARDGRYAEFWATSV